MAKAKAKEISQDVIGRLQAAYRHRRNVTGFDKGYVWKDGKKTEAISLRIHVDRKIPLAELETNEVFPEEFEGHQVDIVEGPYRISETFGSLQMAKKAKTLIGGLSCGRENAGTGTLGCIVIDNVTGDPALLSNWHVLAGPTGRRGDNIVQPGVVDGGKVVTDRIATLERAILGAAGDAAVAKLNGSRQWLPVQAGENVELEDTTDVTLGETLRKHGRTTDTTDGVVDGIGSYRVQYEVAPNQLEHRWIEGFKLVPKDRNNPGGLEISSGGDSGSCWYNPRKKSAVGLHFAGETDPHPESEFALACHMKRVEAALDIRLARLSDLITFEEERPEETEPGTELTPVPDQPDWPWWPWGPFPNPMGPSPFPPVGPWPWPTGPYGPRPLPPVWIPPSSPRVTTRWQATEAAGLETGANAQTLSSQIRAELYTAIRNFLGLPNLELNEFTRFEELATFGSEYGFVIVANAVNASPYFKARHGGRSIPSAFVNRVADLGGVISLLRFPNW